MVNSNYDVLIHAFYSKIQIHTTTTTKTKQNIDIHIDRNTIYYILLKLAGRKNPQCARQRIQDTK